MLLPFDAIFGVYWRCASLTHRAQSENSKGVLLQMMPQCAAVVYWR